MSKLESFGFELSKKTKTLETWYEIVDISSNVFVYSVRISGNLKNAYLLENKDGRRILTVNKISSLSDNFKFLKDDFHFASFSYRRNFFISKFEIQIGKNTYYGSSLRNTNFKFIGSDKKVLFEFYKIVEGSRKRKIVVVNELFNPEIGIIVSVILDRITEPKKSKEPQHSAILYGKDFQSTF